MSVEVPSIYDILLEPSVETLTDVTNRYEQNAGLFVRFGKIILFAPMLKISQTNKHIFHADMVKGALTHEDEILRLRIQTSTQEAGSIRSLGGNTVLMDAGKYGVGVRAGQLVMVYMGNQSTTYGRADEAGRNDTLEIMRAYIDNPEIPVIEMD